MVAHPTLRTGPSTTTAFQPSLALATPKAAARSLTSELPGAVANASEARYWAEKFGLGSSSHHNHNHNHNRLYAHPRQLVLQASTATVIPQVLWGPPTFSKASPLVVVGGPRVQLYGTSAASTFSRALGRPVVLQTDTPTSHTSHTSHTTSTSNKATNGQVTKLTADRQIPTGGSLALAAAVRQDGRLVAVGTQDGSVRIADVTSRAVLATFGQGGGKKNKGRGAALPVRTVAWLRDGQHVVAGGDDGRLRLWSLQTAGGGSSRTPRVTFSGHGDAVRCTALWQASTTAAGTWPQDALLFSGSYDTTIRIWKVDEATGDETPCLAVLPHGAPVEALLVLPAAPTSGVPCWLLSAGGTTIKVWNPLTGVCVQHVDARHRKTITSLLSLARHNPTTPDDEVHMRVFSAGLDGLLRVHAWNGTTGSLTHLHGIPLGVAVTSMAADPTGTKLALGTVDGKVWVRQRGEAIRARKRTREAPAGTYAFFQRGMNATPVSGDHVVQDVAGKKKKLRKFDVALKKFRYGDALDEALETRIPSTVVSVLEELGKRRGLTIALSNRDEESLEPVLAFTVRYIARPRFAALLVGVAHKLLDIYGPVAGQSEVIDELFAKLQQQVSMECKDQQNLLRLTGQIDALLAAAEDDEYNFATN
jgi:U3 small nucleolar RNA-associated protein 15